MDGYRMQIPSNLRYRSLSARHKTLFTLEMMRRVVSRLDLLENLTTFISIAFKSQLARRKRQSGFTPSIYQNWFYLRYPTHHK